MKSRRLAFVAAALCAPLFAHAQNTVFDDAFSADALNAAVYPAITATSTGWDIASSKTNNPPPTNTTGLQVNLVATSSGLIEGQARFAPAPVQLLPGTAIELTATFTPTAVLQASSDNLIVGLFNSGGSSPLPTLLQGGLGSSVGNGVQGWVGYNAGFAVGASNGHMMTRPAQTVVAAGDQDLLFVGVTGAYKSPKGATVTNSPAGVTLTNGETYTLDYTLALSANGSTLTATYSLYNGVGTSGAGTNTRITTYAGSFANANLVTTSFDALAVGWRAGSSHPSDLNFSALTVRTTGGAPWFTAEPPSSLLVTIGDTVNIPASVGGVVGGLQWQKSTDNGSTFTAIDPALNPSAATDTLTLSNVQPTDGAVYRLVASNTAGSSASSAVTVTTTTTPVPPTLLTQPVGGTVQAPAPYTFKVVANGSSPLQYQWQKSSDGGATFSPIAGATGATYAIAATTLADEGEYEVVVTNHAGTVTSAAATLTVNQPLTITGEPTGATLNEGAAYTLQVVATGKPAPSIYQWFLNGSAINGATGASYTIAAAAAGDAGIYTVSVSNSVPQTVTSTPAAVAVLSPTLAASAVAPGATPTGVSPDTPLTLTFNQPIAVGLMGQIRIYDAANPTTPVDTVDIPSARALMTTLGGGTGPSVAALPVQTKTIGGVTDFHYYPIIVSGNTATIYPRNGVLTYGHSYFVQIDPGVFTDPTGLSFAGIGGTSGWTFGTRQTGPTADATWITVAADGSGDFATVQGAIDSIPDGNTTPRTIYIRKGTYFEEVYFKSKHNLTFLGEDRARTVIEYPNNNNFNNMGGTYHRMVFNADHANNVVIANLTINDTTPHGGAQAEALILNGGTSSHAIVTDVDLNSYQDTLQINGSAYVANSHIAGDTDFMWGDGPCWFENCELTERTSGGYFTQIRNGSGNHGNVYVHCRFDAAAGVTGTYLGRIDPAGFPYSEVVVLDSTFGDATNNAFLNPATGTSGSNYLAGWWLLNNASSAAAAPNVHNWSNGLVDATGAAISNPNTDVFTVMPTDATTQANYRDLQWVLNTSVGGTAFGTWTPQLAPIVATQPSAQTVGGGSGFALSVQAFGVPAVTYQWLLNGAPIAGATAATYTVASAAGTNAGMYSVVVSNGAGSVTTDAVPLVVQGGPPVIARPPADTQGLLGADATLSVWALGDGPLAYQWSKDGQPITGATGRSLRLSGLQPADAGQYTVAVSNAGGTNTSPAAALALVAPATTLPTMPVIPGGTFDVTAYGAIGDGATDNTAAIQAAFDAANAAGGGTVEVPAAAAAYLSGPITVYGNTNFQVDDGAVLRALPFGVYPRSLTSPSHFITIAKGATNVEFSGAGTIDGNGADWWAAYDRGTISGRPRLVQITKASNLLFTGLTFLNSPNFHLAFSGDNTNVTLFGVTVRAPGDSPNTDGMDLAGTNFLVQHCSVSDGDDNVVAKPGSVFCHNIYVADCAFGTGHGVSVGGQTNVGLDGMTVTNCTFDGTSTGLRLKADPTQGGPVQNVTYSNLTMTNVAYPILFYSYYNQIGSPGATSGSSEITPAKVNAWNTNPPNSLASAALPTWRNIVVSNLTATGASGYSTIWGLPTASGLINAVTLNNVNISGGAGLEVYDAADVQLTGETNVGPVVTCNGLAITSQPQGTTINAGDSVTFSVTAVGAGGTHPVASTYQWAFNGTPLTDGPQPDGSTLSGSTTATLTITNARVTGAGIYTATVSNTLDGYDVTGGTLVPNSLPVSVTSSGAILLVKPLPATITLSDLTQTYNGSGVTPTFTTSPAGLPVTLSYAGGTTAPVYPGQYAVVATVADPNYKGSTNATLTVSITALVRHAPALDGAIDGSIQVLSPESIALNGSAWISGDLLVPGTPALQVNGGAMLAGTKAGPGAADPANYTVTLNGNAVLRYLVRQVDPIALPVVAAPALPTGTRTVTLESANQDAGDFATIANLTLNGNAGDVALPPGTYNQLTANGTSGFVLGHAGATQPDVYYVQALTLNGAAHLAVAGPVRLVLANGLTLSSDTGASASPRWLTIAVASGGVTVNGSATLYGSVVAPNGSVTLNGGATLVGEVSADRLTINGSALLKEP